MNAVTTGRCERIALAGAQEVTSVEMKAAGEIGGRATAVVNNVVEVGRVGVPANGAAKVLPKSSWIS